MVKYRIESVYEKYALNPKRYDTIDEARRVAYRKLAEYKPIADVKFFSIDIYADKMYVAPRTKGKFYSGELYGQAERYILKDGTSFYVWVPIRFAGMARSGQRMYEQLRSSILNKDGTLGKKGRKPDYPMVFYR